MNMRQQIINEFKSENREVIDWTLYDSQLLAPVSSTITLTFFQNTVGGVTRARTNMQNAGLLPSPESFLVFEIWMMIFNSDGAPLEFDFAAGDQPINVMMAQGYWDFITEPRNMVEGSLNELRTQIGQNAFNANVPSSDVQQTTAKWRKYYLRKPIIIGSARHFRLECTLNTPAAGDGYAATTSLMYWYLRGLKRRNK